jgi:geranylgeranyl reductase family protein
MYGQENKDSIMEKFDVTVVGAGPAGCITAYELAKAGIKTLIIEKEILPRYKCCAGGITCKAAKSLPIDINNLIENNITKFEICFKNHGSFMGESPNELVYTVKREQFDHALAMRAVEAGAILWQGEPLIHLENHSDSVELKTGSRVISSLFVIGADGARSIVARRAGFQNSFVHIAGINAEVSSGKLDFARWNGRILIDVGFIPGGYAWVFPKSDQLAIGIATILPKVKELNRYFDNFLKSLEIKNMQIIRRSGALIPLSKGEPRLNINRIALVGDAAGLADPLSGEGIHNAIQSSQLAANTIKTCLNRGTSNLEDYQSAIYETIMPELKMARVLQKLFVHFPQVVVKLLHFDTRVWRGCCYFARGDLSYIGARQKIGGFKGVKDLLIKARDSR